MLEKSQKYNVCVVPYELGNEFKCYLTKYTSIWFIKYWPELEIYDVNYIFIRKRETPKALSLWSLVQSEQLPGQSSEVNTSLKHLVKYFMYK